MNLASIRALLPWLLLVAAAGTSLWFARGYGRWQQDRAEAEVVARGVRYAVQQIAPVYFEFLRKNRKAPADNAELNLPPPRDSLWVGLSRVELYPNGDVHIEYDSADPGRKPLLAWHLKEGEDMSSGAPVCGARDIPERVLAWNGLHCNADVAVPDGNAPIPALENLPARETTPADQVLDAVRANSAAQLDALRAAGTDLCAANPEGVLPMAEAVRGNQNMAFQKLLAVPCDINQVEPYTGRNALMIVAAARDAEQTRAVLTAGGDVHAKTAEGETAWFVLGTASDPLSQQVRQMLMIKGAQINDLAGNQQTLLMRAAAAGNTQLCEWLLQGGAQIDLQDGAGRTALMHAALAALDNGPMLQLLVNRGAQVNLRDAQGKTALGLASSIADHERQNQVVRILQLAGGKT